jgi:hypothetical protein
LKHVSEGSSGAARIYRERAQRMRRLALTAEDSELSALLSSAADDYEQLANEEEEQKAKGKQPGPMDSLGNPFPARLTFWCRHGLWE